MFAHMQPTLINYNAKIYRYYTRREHTFLSFLYKPEDMTLTPRPVYK